jgi:hypothetical protein
MHLPRLLDLRQPSLLRGTALPILAMAESYWCTGFPEPHPSLWLLAGAGLAAWGALECFRSLRKTWSLLHAGILLLFYTNLMILATILFMIYFLEHP